MHCYVDSSDREINYQHSVFCEICNNQSSSLYKTTTSLPDRTHRSLNNTPFRRELAKDSAGRISTLTWTKHTHDDRCDQTKTFPSSVLLPPPLLSSSSIDYTGSGAILKISCFTIFAIYCCATVSTQTHTQSVSNQKPINNALSIPSSTSILSDKCRSMFNRKDDGWHQ